jgi:pimeloyl-ACP methyl ester carboxylesterase
MITRRQMTAAAAVIAASGTVQQAQSAEPASQRSTFVLVHGAWHGGWCWKYVRDYLEDRGHRVFTPSLTGHGDRVHLRSPQVNIDTHIMDVINLMTWEELDHFVLVGHSYAGFIITGVCDRVKDRVGHVVYLDSFVPKDGDTVLPEPTKEFAESRYGPLEDEYLAYAREPVSFGIPESMPEELGWLRRRLTPQQLGTWIQPISLKNGGSDGVPRTFIYCNDKPPLTEQQATRLKTFQDDPSWNYRELPCGHDSMVILPEATAQMFEQIASTI